MRSKLNRASAVALVTTLAAAIMSAQGSGAAAETGVSDQVKSDSQVSFVSQPVVQALPAQTGPLDTTSIPGDVSGADDDDASLTAVHDAATEAGSLTELVSEQSSGELSEQMRCLASAIYFEARGESLEGQLAVGRVIVNRAASGRFPSSYCGVVYQPSQFSFVRGRSMPAIRTGSASWHHAVAIARIADEGSWNSPAKGALYFHAARVRPGWHLKRLARVDNHVFYR